MFSGHCIKCCSPSKDHSKYKRKSRRERNHLGTGRSRDASGYVYLTIRAIPVEHEDLFMAMAHKNGTLKVLEHRFVMAIMLGRPLLEEENVHHKNGIRDDNRPENLELWNTSQPSGQRIRDKIAWAQHLLEVYADYPQELD